MERILLQNVSGPAVGEMLASFLVITCRGCRKMTRILHAKNSVAVRNQSISRHVGNHREKWAISLVTARGGCQRTGSRNRHRVHCKKYVAARFLPAIARRDERVSSLETAVSYERRPKRSIQVTRQEFCCRMLVGRPSRSVCGGGGGSLAPDISDKRLAGKIDTDHKAKIPLHHVIGRPS